MLLKPNSLEEQIISYLKNGPTKTTALVDYFTKKKSYTKQAVYKIIKQLKKDEVITISKKEASLSSIWLKKMSDFFALAQYNYQQPISAPTFMSLTKEQKRVFIFNNLEEVDIFSAHTFYLLSQVISTNEPIYVFNFHQWFYYGRKENDEFLAYSLGKNQSLLLLLGNNSPLDQAVKKEYNKGNIQAHIIEGSKLFNKYYFAIIGEFLLEILIDQKIARELEIFYKENNEYNELAKNQLNQIIIKKARHKIIISKNNQKIEKYKKLFKKYFYIPK